MRTYLTCFLAAILAALSAIATETGTMSLTEQFRDPPKEFRPLPITHRGPLDNRPILQWVDDLRAGGTVIDAGSLIGPPHKDDEQWVNSSYLNNPEAWQKLRDTMAEMKERGQTVWIYDELGYPSPSAGGRVIEGHPEFQVWALGCRTFGPGEDGAIEVEITHDRVEACIAAPRKAGTLDLSQIKDLAGEAAGGSLSWQAPDGDWVVCLFEVYQPDTWRRHNIPRRNVNIMDRGATDRFIELTHEAYARELGDQLEDVFLFFTDEPQLSATEHWTGGLPDTVPAVQWCDELPAAFAKKHGYPMDEALPALFHAAGPKTAKYRHDFYDTQSDLVADNYYAPITQWCHDHGTLSSGHMLLEESLLLHVMFSGSAQKNWALMDLPGVDLLTLPRYKTMPGWEAGRVTVSEDFSCKMASSVAHLMDKPGVFTESYAVANGSTLPAVRGIAAWQFATGITHMCTYTIQNNNQLSAEDYGLFADFAGRLALLCRRGKPVSDVAVMIPEASVWGAYNPPDGGLFPRYMDRNLEAARIDQVFRDTCHALLEQQRGFECMSEDLLAGATVKEGRLELNGYAFAFLVLPEMRMVREETVAKVEAFLERGGQVLFVGSLPSQSPTMGLDEKVTERIEALLAAYPKSTAHYGSLARLKETATWMAERVAPELRWQGDRSVRILHLNEPERDIVLIANPGAAPAKGTLTLASGGAAALWDCESGDVSEAVCENLAQGAEIDVPADSARFVVVGR